ISDLKKQLSEKKIAMEILLMGGSEKEMANFENAFQNGDMEKRIATSYTGFLNSADLSAALQTCTIGLTPIPRHAIGKSGSVAAFLSHGVPVAAPCIHERFSREDVGFFSPALRSSIIFDPDYNEFKKAKKAVEFAKNEIMLSQVAKSFLYDLQICSNA
ncbi:MAG: hypothetical protein JWQ25_860, partial [Daejeonella sp.]|nr:hypothetical protein [Daejeonella sp.]